MKRKKMYRKKIVFGASITTMILLCSISSAVSVVKDIDPWVSLSNDPDELIVHIDGPDYGFPGDALIFCFSVSGGFPPYNWSIEWGDETNIIIKNSYESKFCRSHIYESEGEFRIFVNVTDSLGTSACTDKWVTIGPRECDLGISIRTKDPYYCKGEIIDLDIRVWSVQNPNHTDCPSYTIFVNITPSNEKHVSFGGTISPGEIRDHPSLPCCFGRLGRIDVKATVDPECLDTNWDNNFDTCHFYVFPEWVCKILDILPDLLIEILFGDR